MQLFSKMLCRIVEKDFVQPVISSNGTMGGNVFACESSTGTNNAYKALDNSTSTQWQSASNYSNTAQWLTFYNPFPINVTKVICTTPKNTSSEGWNYQWQLKDATLQGSNDNVNWVDLGSVTGVGKVATATIEANNNMKFYKYHRIYASKTNAYSPNLSYYCWCCSNMEITAKYEEFE